MNKKREPCQCCPYCDDCPACPVCNPGVIEAMERETERYSDETGKRNGWLTVERVREMEG